MSEKICPPDAPTCGTCKAPMFYTGKQRWSCQTDACPNVSLTYAPGPLRTEEAQAFVVGDYVVTTPDVLVEHRGKGGRIVEIHMGEARVAMLDGPRWYFFKHLRLAIDPERGTASASPRFKRGDRVRMPIARAREVKNDHSLTGTVVGVSVDGLTIHVLDTEGDTCDWAPESLVRDSASASPERAIACQKCERPFPPWAAPFMSCLCDGRFIVEWPLLLDASPAPVTSNASPRDTSALREIRTMIRSVNNGEAHPDEVAQGISDSVVALTANLTDEITRLRAEVRDARSREGCWKMKAEGWEAQALGRETGSGSPEQRDAKTIVAALVAKAGGELRLSDSDMVNAFGLELVMINHAEGGRTYRAGRCAPAAHACSPEGGQRIDCTDPAAHNASLARNEEERIEERWADGAGRSSSLDPDDDGQVCNIVRGYLFAITMHPNHQIACAATLLLETLFTSPAKEKK